MLSRGGREKGLGFAAKVLDSLLSTGVDATLRMSGEMPRGSRGAEGDRIEYLGWITEERKAELITESDFLLMPSEFEGSSMAVIESIVNGLPCIVSPTCAETVGMSSLVLDLRDPEEWAERIQELSDSQRYAEVVDELGQQAKRYAIEAVRGRWGSIYEGLIQEANESNDGH
jgi:glycosyltransferase involved in cell wall biosynthesis